MQAPGFRLGIDFGTSHTIAVLRWPDGRVKPLLFDGSPLLPSAVYAEPDGRLVVGRDALHSARMDPGRFEPNPKRRIDDGAVLLGDREVPIIELVATVLREVANEARRTAGVLPPDTVLTCPAAWGAPRRKILGAAGARAGLGEVRLVEEPVAAATYFARVFGDRMPPGAVVVVYDFGGGTFDVSLVERVGPGTAPPPGAAQGFAGFRTLAADGRDDIGGVDLDAALVRHIGAALGAVDPAAWRSLTEPSTVEERRQRRLFLDDVRAVKERLSRHPSAALHAPGFVDDVHVTRQEFEDLARPLLAETVRLTAGVLRQSGTPAERIAGVFLVGGSSRIPMAATMLHRGLEIEPTVIEQPELVVAEGSILAQGVTVGSGPQTMVASTPAPVSGPPARPLPLPPPPPGPVSPPGPAAARPAPAPRYVPPPPAYRPAAAAAVYQASPYPTTYPSAHPEPDTLPPAPARRRRGRTAVYALVALLLLAAAGFAGYRFLPGVGGSGSGPGAGRASDGPLPDLLYDGTAAGTPPVLVAGSTGARASLPAGGGAVRFVIGVPNGWVVLRARSAGSTEHVALQVDAEGRVLKEVAGNATGIFVNPTGTLAAAATDAGTVVAWKVDSPGDDIRTTPLPAGVRPVGWVGATMLLRLDGGGDGPYRRYDFWDPVAGTYQSTPGETRLIPLGDSGDGQSLMAVTKDGTGRPCLALLDSRTFQHLRDPDCVTEVTLVAVGANDPLPLVSPDGATLLAHAGGGVAAYPVRSGALGGDGARLDLPAGSQVARATWGEGLVFVQTTGGSFHRCRIDSGACDPLAVDRIDAVPATRPVVRFPAG